jgi:hypothetical protein
VVGLGACGFQVGASGDASVAGDSGDGGEVDAGEMGGFVGARRTYVKASNTDINDQFGSNTAVLSADGRTLAVGASGEDSARAANQADNTATDSGAVYVYTFDGTAWSQQAYLKASNAETGDGLGYYGVAISADGNTLAVGASLEDSQATGVNGNEADNFSNGSGAVYVFVRSGTTWTQQAYVKASNPNATDQFGLAVALSSNGNTLAVGAFGESSAATGINGNQIDNSLAQSGAAYVFTRSGATWSQQAYIKASNPGVGDLFGGRLALSSSGDTLAVRARLEDSAATGIDGNQADNSAGDSGAVYVFQRNATTWAQQAYVKASNTDAGDELGSYGVALSADGNTLAVGAQGEDSGAVGVNGDANSDAASDSGAAYVFTRSGTTWTEQAYIKASNTAVDDRFGFTVALAGDGNTLAVGAWSEDSAATGIGGDQADNAAPTSGAVYVYGRIAGIWTQQAYVKSTNTNVDDQFGMGVSLSGNGSVLAVCAYIEDSAATGIDGNQADNTASQAGAVYLLQ